MPAQMKRLSAIILTLLILLTAVSCSRDKSPDFRTVRWGMSKEEVKKAETAELMNEGNDILTYRITGGPASVEAVVTVENESGGEEAPVTLELERPGYEYDLLYVFGNGKLGMAVVHLRETLPEPKQYIALLKEKTEEISGTMGEPATGVAEYGDFKPKQDPYSTPGEICDGKYALRHFWPTKDKRTNVSIELDEKKFTESSDCNLSVFYESVDYPIDPGLSDQLHELL